jgi:exodeoxyribonuclease VII small subunit
MPKRQSVPSTFEQTFTELEAAIEKLEAGNLPLDEAIALYERGMELAKECSEKLDRAELRIRELGPAAGELNELDADLGPDDDKDE